MVAPTSNRARHAEAEPALVSALGVEAKAQTSQKDDRYTDPSSRDDGRYEDDEATITWGRARDSYYSLAGVEEKLSCSR